MNKQNKSKIKIQAVAKLQTNLKKNPKAVTAKIGAKLLTFCLCGEFYSVEKKMKKLPKKKEMPKAKIQKATEYNRNQITKMRQNNSPSLRTQIKGNKRGEKKGEKMTFPEYPLQGI